MLTLFEWRDELGSLQLVVSWIIGLSYPCPVGSCYAVVVGTTPTAHSFLLVATHVPPVEHISHIAQ